MTPMMKQYLDMKERYRDCILFFRLGDFYEMFFEDAITASRELEITLTGKDCGEEERAPMCGVPYHSVEAYLTRLVAKGYKVAICEQTEDPAAAKGLVERDVVRIATPGTVTEPALLEDKSNAYLMSVCMEPGGTGVAVTDLTTGILYVTSILWGNIHSKLIDEISKYSPKEIIASPGFFDDAGFTGLFKSKFDIFTTRADADYFDEEKARRRLLEFADTANMANMSNTANTADTDESKSAAGADTPAARAAGALLRYLDETQRRTLGHLSRVEFYSVENYMMLDAATRRNLEIAETIRNRTRAGSLIDTLDRTVTSLGGRLLKNWFAQPLLDISEIKARHDAVQELRDGFVLRQELREMLRRVHDMERLISRIVLGSANCRDYLSLKHSLAEIPRIKARLAGDVPQIPDDAPDDAADAPDDSADAPDTPDAAGGSPTPGGGRAALLDAVGARLDPLADIAGLIERAISEDAPALLKDGGVIRDGYSEEVDGLRTASRDGKSWLTALERDEREKTGIKGLKIGYNRVFGYYFEVTKSNAGLVPPHYVRRQTLVNGERFISDELKKLEDAILGAEERLGAVERELFNGVHDLVAAEVSRIKQTAGAVAELDALAAFAELAETERYCRPTLNRDGIISIRDGRHPVVEKAIGRENYVPNDAYLDVGANRTAIITGPNMAGKSTFMRQVALIVLMAQAGCFVPASQADIGVTDRIFTRVGAADDLAAGQSTFMVEMSEVSNILENATAGSLIILDEIGRGTSTFDGLSIAWAVVEFINDRSRIGARTLFSTHYHELTELSGKTDGINNYCVAISESGGDIRFLRKVRKGGADGSYGIHVAKLAGLPPAVTERANELLRELEAADISKKRRTRRQVADGQVDFLAAVGGRINEKEVLDELRGVDITRYTPIDALNLVHTLQQKLRLG